MATERVEHAAGGDECNHTGATLSGERTNPDDGEWAGATKLGARRSVGEFGDRMRVRRLEARSMAPASAACGRGGCSRASTCA